MNDFPAVAQFLSDDCLILNVVYSPSEKISYRLQDKEHGGERLRLLRQLGTQFDSVCGFSVTIPPSRRSIGQTLPIEIPFYGYMNMTGLIRFNLHVVEVSIIINPDKCFPYMCSH